MSDFPEMLKSTFELLKEKISSFFANILEYFRENRRTAFIFAGLSLVFIGGIIALICVLSHPETKITTLKQELILSEKLMNPQGPELSNEYTVSRSPRKKWSTEEAERWFTIHSEKDIEGLEKANDGIISELLGAAP